MAEVASATAKTAKVCCKCGRSVSGQKRMKDSEGRYWCLPCGQADQRAKKKGASGTTACAKCGTATPAKQLKEYGRLSYCKKCFKKVTHTSNPGFVAGLFGGGGESSPRNKILIIALVLLGVISLLYNYVFN